jgi:hypothetical protein
MAHIIPAAPAPMITTSADKLDLFIGPCFRKDDERLFYGCFKTTEQKNRTALDVVIALQNPAGALSPNGRRQDDGT